MLCCLNNLLGVQGRWGADDDSVNLRVGEDLRCIFGPPCDVEVRGHGLCYVTDWVSDLQDHKSLSILVSLNEWYHWTRPSYHRDNGSCPLKTLRVHISNAAAAHEADTKGLGQVRVEHLNCRESVES